MLEYKKYNILILSNNIKQVSKYSTILNKSQNWTLTTYLQVTTQFLKLETILDDNVNSNIELQIERGGSSKSLTILVRFLVTHVIGKCLL
jgi:1-deoxy-D-xylulose 5-phosphate reductoisomerase